MKRARPEPSAEETDKEKEATYKKGAILRIKLENFVTYGNVEFRPGPRLNVVIGPNGTGKSTVVCAIALGLGGKPAVLGRAKNEFEFIKAGSGDWATIEIELKGDVKNYIIKRKIIKKGENSDASEWWLDGKRTTEKEVHQVVNSLDIQIDNLCQFLPQDKVASFAKLNEVELLRETEKAIGEKENFFETHEELIKRQKGEKDTQIELEALKQKQKEEKAKQDILERDVLRYRESEKYKARKKDLEAKRPWLIFERHRSQSKELKDTTEKLKAEVEGLKERTAPLRERVNALKTDLAKADREKAGVSASLKQHDADRKSVGRQIEELEAKFETAYADLERAKENAAERKKRIESIKNEIAKQNEELATLRPTADINAELEAKNDQVRKLDEQKSKLAAEHNPLMVQLNAQRRHQNDAERALKDIQDQRNQRLDEVKRTNYESFQFNRWANSPETTGKLTGRAWGPLLLEINVSPEFAPYLEHAVRSSFFKFVAENVDDRNVLLDYADRANAKVTIAVMANRDNLAHPVPDEALRKYGKFKWLNEAFDAPEAVKLYLSQVHRLHEIPVFYEREEDGFIILRENPKLKIVLTRRDSLSRKNSQYTKEASFSRDSIEPPKKLAGVDPNRKHKLEQDIIAAKAKVAELLGKQDEFSDKIKAIDQKIDELRNEVRALRAMAPKRNTIMKRLETLKSDLRDAEKTENLVELEKRVETKLRGYNMERLLHSVKLAEIHASMSDATVKHDMAILRRIKLQAQADRANQALYAAEGELRAREAELERAAEELRKSMDQLKRLKEAAVSEAPLTEELKKKFEELPNTVEALDEEITSTIGKLQALRGHMRDDAVQEYEMKQRELEDMEARIKELMENRERSARTLVSDTLEFKKQLQEKISKIDAACSELFKHLDCPANVTLDSSSEDLSRWSLAIAVSFRKNMKQKALGNTQSGGERAVTTMLFLISLQDYTSCGFRLVDEINQGMDPKNERQVFELIAKSASKPGLPQYFLITPKLLPDLSFDNDTSVLCVFNGPSAPKQRQWNTSVSKLVRGAGAAQ